VHIAPRTHDNRAAPNFNQSAVVSGHFDRFLIRQRRFLPIAGSPRRGPTPCDSPRSYQHTRAIAHAVRVVNMYSTAVSTAAPAPAAFAVRYPTVTFLSNATTHARRSPERRRLGLRRAATTLT
jgi:hypothetical protein